jgi:hypothetical protein
VGEEFGGIRHVPLIWPTPSLMTMGWIKPKHSEASQDDSPHRATDGYYDVIFFHSSVNPFL